MKKHSLTVYEPLITIWALHLLSLANLIAIALYAPSVTYADTVLITIVIGCNLLYVIPDTHKILHHAYKNVANINLPQLPIYYPFSAPHGHPTRSAVHKFLRTHYYYDHIMYAVPVLLLTYFLIDGLFFRAPGFFTFPYSIMAGFAHGVALGTWFVNLRRSINGYAIAYRRVDSLFPEEKKNPQ